MNENINRIKSLGAALDFGESLRAVCPFCEGGQSRESSLRIWRDTPGVLSYCCFRASCKQWGDLGRTTRRSDQPRKVPRLNVYEREQKTLPRDIWVTSPISGNSGKPLAHYLTYEECVEQGFTWGPEDRRVIMPIYNYHGYPVGCVARAVGIKRRIRTLTYREQDATLFHFPVQTAQSYRSETLTITEDIISSIVVSRSTPAASALGTSFTGQMGFICRFLKIGCLQFFYDGDAAGIDAAVRASRGAEAQGFETRVIPCPRGQDPKDLNLDQINMLVLR